MSKNFDAVLKSCRACDRPLYIVGMFDDGVTVYSQQTRALNLVWALIESSTIPCVLPGNHPSSDKPKKIAIVGGGFTGLTVAAGLIAKGVNATIKIFEERDTLLPLQQGSDSRWLHPRIYDWPGDGSDANVAMLPVLNWSAARASDVVVQVLAEWENILTEHNAKPTLYCNARHLQIDEVVGDENKLQIEWIGELRDAKDGTTPKGSGITAAGASENFDAVILAVGFGLERDGALSYWRNETIGQPSLDQPRSSYLVSGQGDGAMIDLLRLCISQFRQDRILDEIFRGKSDLLQRIKEVYKTNFASSEISDFFSAFENLENDTRYSDQFKKVCEDLARRLRRDTDVILHIRVRKLSELFDPKNTRISFQNKILVYFLYKCGGFIPSSKAIGELCKQHSISSSHIIRRHGTLRNEQLARVLSKVLCDRIEQNLDDANGHRFLQSSKVWWSGGYFGFSGAQRDASLIDDSIRVNWRKEYLPGPTSLIATAFCGSLCGVIQTSHPEPGRLRVTLHRSVQIGDEELLQQACDYVGTADARGEKSAAARTFPARNATIGLAYKCRRIVRSLRGVATSDLISAMTPLKLNTASRSMSSGVGFVLAIPILEPEEAMQFRAPNPVAGVIYIDSKADNFFVDDQELKKLVVISQRFLDGLAGSSISAFNRICNIPLAGLCETVPPKEDLPDEVNSVLELVSSVDPPKTARPFQFNFDYSDFATTQK